MADPRDASPQVVQVIEMAFPGDQAPPQLSVSIVSLVELCQLGMPNVGKVRELIASAGFKPGAQDTADAVARTLALDVKTVNMAVRNLRNEIFGRGRHGEPVVLLLSHGESDAGQVVFLSALFRGAVEADAVKAAAHVTKAQPLTGAKARNHDGQDIRRVFWDVGGGAGLRGFMVTGPADPDSTTMLRAFTGFNWAG